MTNETLPFPETQQAAEDKTIRQQFLELEAREKRDAEAVLAAKLADIDRSGNIGELKANLKLRCSFVDKFGWERWGQLNQKHLQRQAQERRAAELAERESKRTISTSQNRIAAMNRSRKAAASN